MGEEGVRGGSGVWPEWTNEGMRRDMTDGWAQFLHSSETCRSVLGCTTARELFMAELAGRGMLCVKARVSVRVRERHERDTPHVVLIVQ